MMRLETAPHAVQTVTKQYIDMRSPTATVLDLVKMLPSMNVSTADTSGMQGGAVEVRSLTDLDMGLMLNGAPTTNAKYLNEEADSENVESVVVTPGSSAIDLPTASAAAGVMDERTIIPSEKMGGMVDFSYGTNNLSREFIRLESGKIGNTGAKAFFSFSNTHARSWMGSGINDRKHIDFGAQKDWTNGSYLKFFASWNYEDFTIDNYPTSAQYHQFKSTGDGWGHTAANDPSQAHNNYWRDNIDHWNQVFLSAPLHLVLPHRLTFDLSPYLVFGQGWDGNGATGGTLATADRYFRHDGTPIADGQQLTPYYQQTEFRQVGAVAKIGYEIDRHNHLSAGYWYENNDSQFILPLSVTMADGRNPSPNWAAYQVFVKDASGNLVRSNTSIDGGYELHALFVEDTAKYFNDRLTVMAGFKYAMTNYWSKVGFVGGHATLEENSTAPLPQLSIGWRFNEHHQIYVNAEGDFRQPDPTSLTTNSSGQLPRNQYSIKEELGYRYNDKYVMIDFSLFNYNITNRLLSTYLGGNRSGVINAGNQTARGFDLLVAGHPFHHFSPYASVEYLHATIDTNIPYGVSYLPTRGKEAVMAPHVMANFGLTYDDSKFFGNFGLHYAGSQSVTLVGDQRIPGYVTDTLSIGYHFQAFFYAKSPTFRLSFTNLTNSIVRTAPKGVVSNMNAVTLVNGGVGPSATTGAQFYVEPRFTVTGTLSTSF